MRSVSGKNNGSGQEANQSRCHVVGSHCFSCRSAVIRGHRSVCMVRRSLQRLDELVVACRYLVSYGEGRSSSALLFIASWLGGPVRQQCAGHTIDECGCRYLDGRVVYVDRSYDLI